MHHLPLTGRQHRTAILLLVLATYGLFSRPQALVFLDERALLPRTFLTRVGLTHLVPVRMENRLDVDGHPRLVVGDSAVYQWPDDWDVLSWPGYSAQRIDAEVDKVRLRLEQQEYDLIVVWLGTVDLLGGTDPVTIAGGTKQVLDRLRPHTAQLIAVMPMPTVKSGLGGLFGRYDTKELTAAVKQQLAATTDVLICDPTFLRELAARTVSTSGPLLFRDDIHLNADGYALLIDELERLTATGLPG